MTLLRGISVLFAAAVLVGCAQQPLLKQTASGKPEGVFPASTQQEVKNLVTGSCARRGLMTMEYGQNQVECSKTLSGGDAFIAQMAVGNSYSTTPEHKVRFTFIQEGSDVRVIAHQWIESQMAYGQVRRQELNQAKHTNDVQGWLSSLGSR